MASLDLELEVDLAEGGRGRLVAEPLVCASPVDLRSSSFGFPSITMLADLPLVWIDGLVMVVDGGYLLVKVVFSFFAMISLVTMVMDLARKRPGIGGGGAPAPALALAPAPAPAPA